MLRELSLIVVGSVGAVALMLSCSDDSPPDADAAVCDCPTLTTVQDVRPAQGGTPGVVFALAACPAGSTLVGGGCELSGNGSSQLILFMAGRRASLDPPNYGCEWNNPNGETVTTTAWATCQIP